MDEDYEVVLRVYIQFGVDVAHVGFGRGSADDEGFCYLLRCVSIGKHIENLLFSFRETISLGDGVARADDRVDRIS